VSELEKQARRLGYALVPLDVVATLHKREEVVAAAEERGRGFEPLISTLGRLAGETLPEAVAHGRELAEQNADLRRQVAQLASHFAEVYVVALEAEVRGDPMPPRTAKAPDTPPGVHPGSHDLNQRIQKYMLDRDLPQRDYQRVLEEVMTGVVILW
jgi:hypothetical protein